MKEVKKKASAFFFVYKIFNKCRKDSFLMLYGIFVYFLSGVLTGLVFPIFKTYYFMYGLAASGIPVMFLYLAQVYTKDRSKSKIVVMSLCWAANAYFGTLLGEYPYLKGKLLPISLSLGDMYSSYGAIYLELGKLFNIFAATILIANYYLCVDKFLITGSKKKSLNEDMDVNINYSEGFLSFNIPAYIRPNIWLYFSAPIILAAAFLFLYYLRGIPISDRILFRTIAMLAEVSLIMVLILDFSKVMLTKKEIVWHERYKLKRTKLFYKDIKSLSIQSQLIETYQRKVIVYANTKQHKHIIDGKFLSHKKLSKIIKIIHEKAPDIQMDKEAKNMCYEKISVSSMKGSVTAYILLSLITINCIFIIILRSF